MIFRVGVGESDFAALRRSGKYYVDKTAVMYELVEETEIKSRCLPDRVDSVRH